MTSRRMSMRVAPSSPQVSNHSTTPSSGTQSTVFSQSTFAQTTPVGSSTTSQTTITPSHVNTNTTLQPPSNQPSTPSSTLSPMNPPPLNVQPSVSTTSTPSSLQTPLSTPHRQSISGNGYRTMRSLRSTMDPSIYQSESGGTTPTSQTSELLPSHLSRNNLNQPEVSVTRGQKPGDEVSVLKTKEDEEEDQKLRDKEKTYSWDDLRKLEDHAFLVRKEILDTEASYVQKLEHLCQHYVEPLNKLSESVLLEQIGITPQHRTALVSNLTVINGFQQSFKAALDKAGPNKAESTIIEYSHFFRLYSQYATDYQKMIDTLAVLAGSRKFQAFTTVVDMQLVSAAGGANSGQELLHSYLILPIQRIPRYELLLRELKRHTVPSNPAFEIINKALGLVRQTATHINETNKKVENMHKLISLQKRIKGDMKDFVLVQPHRRQLREATVLLAEPHKKSLFGTIKSGLRIIFLFNDIVVWTNTDFEFKTYLNIASISTCTLITDYVLEIATSEKLVHLNFFTEKGMPPSPDSDKGHDLKTQCDEWFQELSRLVEEGQAERRRKRTIQSRNDNQRTQTHRLIVNKFNTLDRKQMEELQAEQARQNALAEEGQ